VMHLWTVVITAWMYLTPIFWTTDFISQMAHWIQVLVVVNPMYNYLQFMRDIFLFNTVPSALTFGLCVVWAILALAIGYAVFHKTEHKFILYI
ncbi:MAG: ABC transporter permease, partial [Collinsella sp.]|nr:ABC transporter permease [Collinsella sp.]